VIESYLRGFERISAADEQNAPDWARSLRLSAITRFETLGFPTTKNEDWHFTSVAPIAEREFDLLAPPKHGVKAAQLAPFTFGASDWHTLVFVNGRYDAALSSSAALPDGVTLVPLRQAYESLPLLVEQYLGKVATFDGQTFTALNTSFLDDGAVLHVGQDVEVARPIHLLFVSETSAGTGTAQPRNLLVLDRFA
jgi:Fe-S cluster assembly protein SufD